MPDSLVHIVQDIDVGKPYLIWRALLAEFQRDTMSSRLALRRVLYNSHLGNKDFSEYVAGIRNVVKRIKSLGDHIDDTALVTSILNGLPESFDPVITSISVASAHDDLMDSTTVISLVQDFVLKMSIRDKSSEETAFHSQSTSDQREACRNFRKGRCRNGGSCRYLHDVGLERKVSRARTGQDERKCYFCDRPGHVLSQCTELQRHKAERKARKVTAKTASAGPDQAWDGCFNTQVVVDDLREVDGANMIPDGVDGVLNPLLSRFLDEFGNLPALVSSSDESDDSDWSDNDSDSSDDGGRSSFFGGL
jgi:hypothetical protein